MYCIIKDPDVHSGILTSYVFDFFFNILIYIFIDTFLFIIYLSYKICNHNIRFINKMKLFNYNETEIFNLFCLSEIELSD